MENKTTIISPSILSADFSNLNYELKKVEKSADNIDGDIIVVLFSIIFYSSLISFNVTQA